MKQSTWKQRDIFLPPGAERILRTLKKAGFEAYVVGGCVRDQLLGKIPQDWDITTSALPGQVKALFSRTVDTGIAHGTVTVLMDGQSFEVTTYRLDGIYEDGRHPRQVTFTPLLAEDLRRRDFTINAMAYDPQAGLVDLFGGQEDLAAGRICCVGEARERLSEDALRMMRAVRFSAQLGFSIEEKTGKAIRELAPGLSRISAERIHTELSKLLLSAHPDWLKTAWELGLTAIFLPEFDTCMACPQETPHHCYTVGEHILHSLVLVRPDPVLRLTMLLHDMAKPMARVRDDRGRDHFKGHGPLGEKLAREILVRLKFDNATIRQVTKLVYWHDLRPSPQEGEVRKAISQIGKDLFPLYLEVQKADMLAQSTYRRQEKQARLEGVKKVYEGILKRGDPISLKDLAVSGTDLMEAGIPKGPLVGETLNRLLALVLEDPSLNEKETLLYMANRTESDINCV